MHRSAVHSPTERTHIPQVHEAVRALRQPWTPNYPAGPYLVEPMPASKHEIDGLRSILRYARSLRTMDSTARMLADALERALAYLEEPDSRVNVMRFILGALHASMRKVPHSANVWHAIDRDLQDWAMRQIEDLLGPFPTDEPDRVEMSGQDPGPIFSTSTPRKERKP